MMKKLSKAVPSSSSPILLRNSLICFAFCYPNLEEGKCGYFERFEDLANNTLGRLYPSKGETKHTFDEVCALARLSHKYHIQDVEEQALALLRQPYTDSFDQWLRGSAIVSNSPVHAIGAVNIARLTDTPSLLPLAFYRCCSLGPKLLDGWKREDGHVEHLAVDDLKICFAAHERLCKEGAQIFFKIFRDQPSEECSRADKCRAGLNELVQSMTKSTLLLAIECSVLSSWRSIITKVASDHDICDACSKELHKRDERARKEVWDKLADLFGVRIPTRH